MTDTIKDGAASTESSGDWRLAVAQALPNGITVAEQAPVGSAPQARAYGGSHLRLARHAPLLQSQDILGALMREVNGTEESLLTARSGA